ncbi:MAG: helix-turn-helix domain-containing protein [Acidobacteriota bacterium]
MKEIRPSSREALLAAATRILAANPGASLGDVAARAGVGRATLYRQFRSRDELIRELTLQAIRATDEAVAPIQHRAVSATEMLHEVIEAVVPLGDRYYFLSREFEVMKDPTIARELERQLRELSELIEAVKTERHLAPEVPTAWIVATLDALIYAAWSAQDNGLIASHDAAALVLRTLFEGLGSRDTTVKKKRAAFRR